MSKDVVRYERGSGLYLKHIWKTIIQSEEHTLNKKTGTFTMPATVHGAILKIKVNSTERSSVDHEGCSSVQKIVIEIVIAISMEQTRLFQCDQFHYADYFDWNRDWFFRTSTVLVLKNCDWNRQKSIIERTRLFQCNRFHCAENRQSPSRVFREVTSTNQY